MEPSLAWFQGTGFWLGIGGSNHLVRRLDDGFNGTAWGTRLIALRYPEERMETFSSHRQGHPSEGLGNPAQRAKSYTRLITPSALLELARLSSHRASEV